jgi:hypothetical protein
MLFLRFDRLFGKAVELPQYRRVVERIPDDFVAVQDRTGIVAQPGQQRDSRHIAKKFVTAGRGIEQWRKPKILREVALVAGEFLLRIEISVRIKRRERNEPSTAFAS